MVLTLHILYFKTNIIDTSFVLIYLISILNILFEYHCILVSFHVFKILANYTNLIIYPAAEVAQWVRPASERLCVESQPPHTSVVKTGSDNSIAKRSAIGVSVTDPQRWPLYMDAHSRCDMLITLIAQWP